ncbi:MAG: hypothetical protein ACJ8LG_12900 [Massilia sp.]
MKRKFEVILLGILFAFGLAACSSMGGGNWGSSNGGVASLYENTESGNWPLSASITNAGGRGVSDLGASSMGASGSGASSGAGAGEPTSGGGGTPPESQ